MRQARKESSMFEVAKAYEQRMGSWSKLLSPLFIEFVGVQGEVLDVGCGTGSLTFTVAKNKEVTQDCRPRRVYRFIEYAHHLI